MKNNNNASWIEILNADITSIRGIGEYVGEQLEEILKHLTTPPQEGESLYIPALIDGYYTITAWTTVVTDYKYNPDIDDLEEVIEKVRLKKGFIVSNERLYRNDKLAVVISPDYGVGWYTWLRDPLLLTHPLLVKRVEQNAPITSKWLEETLHIDMRGYDDDLIEDRELKIKWVPKGCSFKGNEYDGAETIEFFNPKEYILA